MIYIRFRETQVQYLYLITRLIFWLSEGLSSTKLRHKFRAFYTYNIVYGQLYSTTLKLKVCFEVVHININIYSQHLFSSSCNNGIFRIFVVHKKASFILLYLQLAILRWHVCLSNGNSSSLIGQESVSETLEVIEYDT